MTTSRTRGRPRARVIGLPYAGGSSLAYRGWPRVRADVELVTPDYPGHVLRPGEPLVRSVADLVEQLLDDLPAWWDVPFILCGTSLGALVAFELAAAAEKSGHPPAALVLCACAAPGSVATRAALTGLADDDFIAGLSVAYGGTISSLLDDQDVRAELMPIVRADIEAFETYMTGGGPVPAPVTADIIAVSAWNDKAVDFDDVAAWRDFSTGTTKVLRVGGDHFFIESNPLPVLAEIRTVLRRVLQ